MSDVNQCKHCGLEIVSITKTPANKGWEHKFRDSPYDKHLCSPTCIAEPRADEPDSAIRTAELANEDDFTHYFNAVGRLHDQVTQLQAQLTREQECVATAEEDIHRWKRQAKELQAQLAGLQFDLEETRTDYSKVVRAVKNVRGYKNWPDHQEGFSDYVVGEIDKMQTELAAEWQPIETAPKDGSPVLVAKLEAGKLLWWFRAKFRLGGKNGWVTYGGFGGAVAEPSHWLLLPEAIRDTEKG